MKAKIIVYENAFSSNILYRFETVEDLLDANEEHDWFADQIEINGYQLLGWDELYDFV